MADKRISQLIERTDIANNDVLPIVASGATTTNKVTISTIQTWMQDNLDVGVTSVGLSMPSAFVVSNSPVTASGNITVTGAGTVAQYIRGDGSLADFPTGGGGGSSVSYYLNGSVSQGTIGGIAYLEMNKTPILGAGTDFTINADGYIASFITDAGDPGLLEIPAGNWNFETYIQASSGGGSPTFYIELYKVNSGGTATLIASNSGTPESISLGTNINPYFSALAVPQTTLALTDRIALRYYVTHAGRTITLHTENNTLCQIITTFTTGLTALNGLTAQVQNFATGTSGTDFNISSAVSTHTFNIPSASATARGLVTTGSQTIAGAKTFSDDAVINGVSVGRGASSVATNTRLGFQTLVFNTTGSSNTSVGWNSLYLNTTGSANSSFGTLALENNTTGGSNTALGYEALKTNTTGGNNTAVGFQALRSNTGNGANTAVGNLSLWNNTAGLNTALGHISLYSNTTGEYNVGLGIASLYNNTTGSYNIAIGDQSGQFISGGGNNIISNNSLFIGTQTRALGNNQTNQIVIGHYAIGNGSNTVTIGNDSITSNIFSGNLSTRRAVGTASEGIIELRPNTGSSNIIIASGAVPLHILSTSGSLGLGVGNTPQVTIASGGAVTLTGNLTANSFIKTGGTSSQFLKADGSVDSSTYLTTSTAASTYLPLVGGTLSGTLEMGTTAPIIFMRGANSGVKVIQYANTGGSIHWSLQTSFGAAGEHQPFSIRNGVLGTDAILIQPASNNITVNNSITNLLGSLIGTSASFTGDVSLSGSAGTRSLNITSNTSGNPTINLIAAGVDSATISYNRATSELNFANSGASSALKIASTGAATFSSSVTAGDGLIINDGNGIPIRIQDISAAITGQTAGYIGMSTSAFSGNNGDLVLYPRTSVDSRILLMGGNVGIGTASPGDYLLALDRNAAASVMSVKNSASTGFSAIHLLNNSGTLMGHVGYANSGVSGGLSDQVFFGSIASKNVVFTTADTERMRITSGGNVQINNNLATGRAEENGVRLSIKGATSGSDAYAIIARNNNNNDLFVVRNDGATALSTFTYGNTVSGSPRTTYIESSGFLGGISSVIASKKNIQNVLEVDWIYELNPVTFNYRKKDKEGNYTEEIYEDLNYGLIAEDTAPVADFLVNYNEKEDGTKEMIGIEYMRLITPMLKAIQELKAEVEALKSQING